MIESAASSYRTKEQVLLDLGKALHFSPQTLEENRKGKLSLEQVKHFAGKLSRPATMTMACIVAPLFFWTGITASHQQVSFNAAFPLFFGQFAHLGQLLDEQGKLYTLAMLGSTIGLIVLGLWFASKFSVALYFDLLDRSVVKREGRVTGREEQTMRENGRDPIEKYYFDCKTQVYEVNSAAVRALESGSVYVMYLLPRSEVLVSLEPKIAAPAA